jgi:hypothetical protein
MRILSMTARWLLGRTIYRSYPEIRAMDQLIEIAGRNDLSVNQLLERRKLLVRERWRGAVR